MSKKSETFSTIHLLRAIGIILVVYYHLFVWFFDQPETAAWFVNAEPINAQAFHLKTLLSNIPISIGQLGVSFFFVISGFLLVPSLERHRSSVRFLSHKFFRLWPTYLASLFLSILYITLFNLWQNNESHISCSTFLMNLFWLRDFAQFPMIDPVVWTIEIQIKFYIFSLIIWKISPQKYLELMCCFVFFTSIFLYMFCYIILDHEPQFSYVERHIFRNLKFFTLILSGVAFYQYVSHSRSISVVIGIVLVLYLIFISPLYGQISLADGIGHLLGPLVLGMIVFFKKLDYPKSGPFKRLIEVISSISYPVFTSHVIPSLIIMFVTIDMGASVYLGILVSLLYVFFISMLLHIYVETPFINIERTIIQHLRRSELSFSKTSL